MSGDITIRGGKALAEALKTLPAKLEKNIMRSAMRAGANVIRDEARSQVPVDQGDLRKSIRVSAKAKGGKVSASVKAGNKTAWYAHLVEFGTSAHTIKARKARALDIGGALVREVQHPGAKAQPFMRPAMDAKAGAALAAVAEQIRKRLTQQGLNVPAPEPAPESDSGP